MFLKGKLPSNLLKEKVLDKMYTRDSSVLLGPQVGEDFAVLKTSKELLVVHSDPITGAIKNIGWYAVHIVCNDIATSGVRPKWLIPVILIPVGREDLLDEIINDISSVAKELGVIIVGGHTEFTPGLDRPIISMTAIAEADLNEVVLTKNSKPGDLIILTKGVGIEGTSIIANELEDVLSKHIGRPLIESAKRLSQMISVVKDAQIAVNTGGVHAMHDPTEGGIAMGLQELAITSRYGIEVYEEKMIFLNETLKITNALDIDPLRLMSSGSLLIVASKDKASDIVSNLKREGINASIIGSIIEDKNRVVIHRKNGSVFDLTGIIEEELWNVLEKYNRL
ncbi:MAG: AIR synthase [Thermofilum sp. ex4484_79]|nr:MAG: AIR synthase [Thermofilum sp. ex4484_79]